VLQFVHVDLGLSSLVVNSPAEHDLHVLFPVASWYCPLKQFGQKLKPASEALPTPQSMHVAAVVAPDVVEYCPCAHGEQVALPVDVLYVPGSQTAHGPPFGPEEPALQMQLAKVPLPSGEYEFEGHPVQAEAPDSEYSPAPHAVLHVLCPVEPCL
jgi:hypothetical protein